MSSEEFNLQISRFAYYSYSKNKLDLQKYLVFGNVIQNQIR